MKVRIGNDIALNVHLSQKYISDPINIKNIQCFVTPANCCQDSPFAPSKYDINRCGLPVYHAMPCCDGVRPACHSYSMRPYNGFGVDINRNEVYVDDCCENNGTYRLSVRSLGSSDSFISFFPAYEQKTLGKYKLIVVAELFQPGYSDSNIRTVTIDYPDVFELVATSAEADATSSVSIQVGNGSDPAITDICISPASITDVIAGNMGMIIATVCPSTNSNQNFLWDFDCEYMDVFDDKGSTLVFETSNIPASKSGKYETSIKVYAADNISVSAEVPVTIHNHMDHLDIVTPIDASKLSPAVVGSDIAITPLYKEVDFGEDIVIVPTVVLQNGNKISWYEDEDGSLQYAADVRIVEGAEYVIADYMPYDEGAADADKYVIRLTDGTAKIRNNNTSGLTQTVKMCITSNIEDMHGETQSFYYTAKLAPKG